jgi:hypothetical protein
VGTGDLQAEAEAVGAAEGDASGEPREGVALTVGPPRRRQRAFGSGAGREPRRSARPLEDEAVGAADGGGGDLPVEVSVAAADAVAEAMGAGG